jgi:peptidoglycan/LPS O-acetylase OafA/YrhL
MPKRLVELDYLRAYAVAMVMALHFILNSPPQTKGLQDFLTKEHLGAGVDLFFVISGYVISGALHELWNVRTAQEALRQKFAVVLFYAKRCLRLWPAMAFWLLANVLVSAVLNANGIDIMPPPGEVLRKAVSGMVYLFNFQEYAKGSSLGYFWSLSVEWQFYVVFPLLLLLVRDMTWRLTLLALSVVAFLYVLPGGGGWWMFRFYGVVIGIFVYFVHRRLGVAAPRVALLDRGWARALTTLGLLAAIAMAACFMQNLAYSLLLSSIISGALVWFAAGSSGFVSCFGMRPLVRWTGSRSYSLYLCHVPANTLAILLLKELGLRQPTGSFGSWTFVYYLVSLGFALVCAELTYRLIEKPSHAASRRLTLADLGYLDARAEPEGGSKAPPAGARKVGVEPAP